MGWLWVLANVVLVKLGMRFSCPVVCSLVVGGVDGMIIAVIAIAKASANFQAVTTGLLGGIGINGLGSEENLLTKAANSVHEFIDSFVNGFGTPTGPDNPAHAQIEAAVLRIVWTAIFVVLASLVAEWARTSKSGELSR